MRDEPIRGHAHASRSSAANDEGVTSITGFAIAVAVYGIAFAAFLAFVQGPGFSEKHGGDLDAQADGAIEMLVNTAGGTADPATRSWHLDPDDIERFGLTTVGEPGRLDLDKLKNLTRGNLSADGTNGLLDYAEARKALGLDDYSFHLRTYPLLSRLEDAGPRPIKNMKVAYLADYTKISPGAAPPYSYTVNAAVDPVFVNVTLTNSGAENAVFQGEFSMALKKGVVVKTANTALLAAGGGSQTISLRIYHTPEFRWAGSDKNVTVRISDANSNLLDFKIDLAAVTLDTGPANGDAFIFASADKVYYRTNQEPSIKFDVIEADGDPRKNVEVNISIREHISGNLVAGWQGLTDTNNKWDVPYTLAAGEYDVAIVKVGNTSFKGADRFQVTDAPGSFPGNGDLWIEEPWSKGERRLVYDLVEEFTNKTFDADGDVYPDRKDVMNNDLANNLSAGQYDALVVGSNVDQNAMTSAAAKHAVRDFVLGGGLLIVLGSTDQVVTWLQPLFHASLTTSGDGIGAPDPTHPLLHAPEELAYERYQDGGRSWEFNSDEDASHFTHILTRAGATRVQDVVTVSKPGHFANGTIVLTGWMAWNLTAPHDPMEAQRMMYNFLLQAQGPLYVDFGPPIPGYAEVASATRLATSPNPSLPGEEVMVRLVLYVFR